MVFYGFPIGEVTTLYSRSILRRFAMAIVEVEFVGGGGMGLSRHF